MHDSSDQKSYRPDTVLAHVGRHPEDNNGFVNPPVIHASTVLSPTLADMHGHTGRYNYGRSGTPTTEALEEAMTALEGAAGTKLAPSGLGAIALALQSCLSAGDHLLVTDSVYGPTRRFCETVLKRFGVETTYYDPLIGADIAALFRDNTRAVFTEAPGSLTFEMQDIPAIAEVAHARGALVLMDNTWATPLCYAALAHGVDLSIHAGTKYIVGHSDVMIGTVSANEKAWPALQAAHRDLGLHVGPDDVYLALRGLRTMGVRLRQHQENALTVATWLEARDEVSQVLYPPLESDPGHALWKRDFTGASGLMSLILKPASEAAVAAMVDGLKLFGIGASWGGFESLVIVPQDMASVRTATGWNAEGPLVRLHIGLEDTADLMADLAEGFERLTAAGA